MATDKVKELINQIEDRKNLYIEKDAHFVKSQKSVEQFKVKAQRAETRCEELRNKIAREEEEMASEVLAGGPVDVGKVNQLRQKLSEAEDEFKIMTEVIQQAEKAFADLKANITKEYSISNATILADAIDHLSIALETTVVQAQSLREACGLPYLSGSNWSVFRGGILQNLSELEKAIRELRAEREKQRQSIRDIEEEPWNQ